MGFRDHWNSLSGSDASEVATYGAGRPTRGPRPGPLRNALSSLDDALLDISSIVSAGISMAGVLCIAVGTITVVCALANILYRAVIKGEAASPHDVFDQIRTRMVSTASLGIVFLIAAEVTETLASREVTSSRAFALVLMLAVLWAMRKWSPQHQHGSTMDATASRDEGKGK